MKLTEPLSVVPPGPVQLILSEPVPGAADENGPSYCALYGPALKPLGRTIMSHEFAFVVRQLKVAVCPTSNKDGVIEKEFMTGGYKNVSLIAFDSTVPLSPEHLSLASAVLYPPEK